jgi:hypothetical protein
MNEWGIPDLRPDRLSALVPRQVYAGGLVNDSASTLFIFRSCTFPQGAAGGTLCFYIDDYRFSALYNRAEHYAQRFASFWGAVCEPDFSIWRNAPVAEQLWSVYRTRTLGRLYQDHGLNVIPNLNWSDARSYSFCFAGIPVGAPVVACECRTAAGTAEDRAAFLAGLAEGVRQVEPDHVLIYGGREHAHWLTPNLPLGPQYTLLESWTHARDRIRAGERRRLRQHNQGKLFPSGGEAWVAEAAQAAGE